MQATEPGWYDDPGGSGGQRYWDGTGWTARTRNPTPRSHPPAATPPTGAPASTSPAPSAPSPAGAATAPGQPTRQAPPAGPGPQTGQAPPTDQGRPPGPAHATGEVAATGRRSSGLGARLLLAVGIVVGAGLIGSGATAIYLLTTADRDNQAGSSTSDRAAAGETETSPRPSDTEPPPPAGDQDTAPPAGDHDNGATDDGTLAEEDVTPAPDHTTDGPGDDEQDENTQVAGATGLSGPVRLTGVGGLNLRTQPGDDASSVTELRPGIVYEATGVTQVVEEVRWYEVLTPDGERGWANGRHLAAAELADIGPDETGMFVIDGVVALNLRAGPDIAADVITEVTAGTIVQALGETFDDGERIWVRVSLPDGTSGWISSRFLDRRA